MGFETRKLIFRVTMAAVVSVAAIFVIHARLAGASRRRAAVVRKCRPNAERASRPQQLGLSSRTCHPSVRSMIFYEHLTA